MSFLEELWSDVEATGSFFAHVVEGTLDLAKTTVQTTGGIVHDTTTSVSDVVSPKSGTQTSSLVYLAGIGLVGYVLFRFVR